MDSTPRTVAANTPAAKEKSARSKVGKTLRSNENVNPNESSLELKSCRSPSIVQSEKSTKKPASKNPNPNQVARVTVTPSPKKKIRERKFVIAKKKVRKDEQSSILAVGCDKCKKTAGKSKCLCVAYENLRASQEDFFRNRGSEIGDEVFDKLKEHDTAAASEELESNQETRKPVEKETGGDNDDDDDDGEKDVLGELNCGKQEVVQKDAVSVLKRSRDNLLEETRRSVMAVSSGRVMNLVKEFERLSVLKTGDSNEVEEDEKKDAGNKESPALGSDLQVSSSSFSPSDLFLTTESLGLDPRRSYSLDSQKSFCSSTSTSAGGQKPRRKSTESSGNRARRNSKKKLQKPTSLKPFMLKTEERGRFKEEEFMKKLQKMLEEEEKMRIPIAQGLPWTTDEPECLVKPSVKEITKPAELVLHSDVRAMERSEFDHQVAMKMSFIEQYRMERERLQKMEEEEEIRRLRKELVPKAQPLPYFDRPFIPQRSMRQPTVPKEPKFHLPENKKIKSHLSLEDMEW